MGDECLRCPDRGMCCREIRLQLAAPLSLDVKKWVELHPGLTVYDHMDVTFIRIEIPCSALDPVTGDCNLFGTKLRPRMCGDWPKGDPVALQAPEGCVFLEPIMELDTPAV